MCQQRRWLREGTAGCGWQHAWLERGGGGRDGGRSTGQTESHQEPPVLRQGGALGA